MADAPPEPVHEPAVFRKRHRLTHDREYQAVYGAKVRQGGGPLLVFVMPTDRAEHRLGLSVGRRIGGAVARNRVKRMIREAFRLGRAGFPTPAAGAYDLVVTVRAHPPAPLASYQRWLSGAVQRAHEVWQNRAEDSS